MHLKKKHLRSAAGLLTLSCSLLGLSKASNAHTYYVDVANGNDVNVATVDNSGVRLKTIKKALDNAVAKGVDTIIVYPGAYPENFGITINGLTLKAVNDATATTSQRSILRPSGPNIWNVIAINASNVTVRGFEVDGSNAYVDGSHTTAGTGYVKQVPSDPGILTYGDVTNGIIINGKDSGGRTGAAALHVSVNHCIVHDNGGGGISTQNDNYLSDPSLSTVLTGGPDYITIEDNVIYNNSFYSKYETSGVSLHGDSNTSTGDTNPHVKVQRNRIYNNACKFTGDDFYRATSHTDGNGIIIDTAGQSNPPTLIQNNLIYKNGGRGIHCFNSSNVMGINDTLYKNNQDPDISASSGGELTAISAHNVTYASDIVYGVGGNVPAFIDKVGYAYGQAGGTNVNIYFHACTYYGSGSGSANIPAGAIDWSTVFNQNPYLHSPDSGDLTVDVAPGGTQYVIDRASTVAGEFASDDFHGTARPATGKDRGAYERSLTSASYS